MRLGHTHKAYT